MCSDRDNATSYNECMKKNAQLMVDKRHGHAKDEGDVDKAKSNDPLVVTIGVKNLYFHF